jgi:alanyl aminopeptidase
VPVVEADLACANGRGTVSLEQRRYVPLGSEVSTDSRWPVPVQLIYGRGDQIAKRRAFLSEAKGSAELDFCPEWIQLNDGGVGYYIGQYSPALFRATAERASSLPVKEQVAFVKDTSFLFGSGDLAPEAALGVVGRFASHPNRLITEAAMSLVLSVDEHFFAEPMRGNYERFVRATFGARARELGFAPRPGEPLDDTLLRPQLLNLVGDLGADPELRAEARRLTEAWFVDPKAVSPEVLDSVLRLAARDGDVALFDRLVEKAASSQDPRLRRDVIRALGRFRDPAAVEKALAVVVSGRFDIRETAFSLLYPLSNDRVARDRVFEWVKTSYDGLAKAMPEQYAAALVYTGIGFCDTARKAEVHDFFAPRYEKVTSGPNNLARVEDVIGICIGRKASQGKGVEEFLKAY